MISVVSFCGPDFLGNGCHDTQFFSFDLFLFLSLYLCHSVGKYFSDFCVLTAINFFNYILFIN